MLNTFSGAKYLPSARVRGLQTQAVVRLEARLAVRSAVLAVSLQPAALVSYGTVKLGLRHAVSAYCGSPWG